MLLFNGGLALIFFAVWVFCIIDVITTPEGRCRNLPKLAWLLIVILLVDVGAIVWLLAGRPWNLVPAASRAEVPLGRTPPRPAPRVLSPDDDEEFLAGLRARAEEQRRRAREAQQRDEPPNGDAPSA
jgi:hypothetical protein